MTLKALQWLIQLNSLSVFPGLSVVYAILQANRKILIYQR